VFAKHLPPSAGQPRVLALDDQSAAELSAVAAVIPGPQPPAELPPGPFDAIAGQAAPEGVAALARRLRPGGRLILAAAREPEALLAALTGAGLIHCLVEAHAGLCVYRGERPPQAPSAERLRLLAGADVQTPYVFLLITQTPNKPAWRLAPGERVEWRAATVLDPATGQPRLLAFSALVKAVAFMQPAVLAGALAGVNKVGKFPAEAARGWVLPLAWNPAFEALRGAAAGLPYAVDPAGAITGEE
jgi:hypothetical protein